MKAQADCGWMQPVPDLGCVCGRDSSPQQWLPSAPCMSPCLVHVLLLHPQSKSLATASGMRLLPSGNLEESCQVLEAL